MKKNESKLDIIIKNNQIFLVGPHEAIVKAHQYLTK